jgi:betaine-aldehyde dehydrogenase
MSDPTADLSGNALFIGGEWRKPEDGSIGVVISPSTEEIIATAGLAGEGDIAAAVAAARDAFDHGPWPSMSPAGRADVLDNMARGVQRRADLLDHLGGAEGGAIVPMAQAFRQGAESLLTYYADFGRTFAGAEQVTGLVSAAQVRHVPIGVCAVIVPWNAPLSIAMFAVAPALAAGCTVVLKSPTETPLAVYLLGEIAAEAGLPAGVLNIVCADRDVSESLVRDPRVDKISFTGSTAVGRRVASIAGESLVPVTLELGGKSAAIVLDDADVTSVATQLTPLTMLNSGQACTNATRLLVPRRRHAEFVDAIAATVASYPVGDPFDPGIAVGPLISARQRARVEEYFAVAKSEGARAITGGGRPAGLDRGYFVAPTLYDGVDNSMRIAREEIFGPVVTVIDYDGDDEAVAIANDSDYGLSGIVWSADADRATAVATRVRTGHICINGYFLDWAVPFGGMKASGLGREFGRSGFLAFCETQSVQRAL